MQKSDQDPQDGLKWLRRLVITLLLVMIAGFITLIGLFVMRFSALSQDSVLPAEIALPSGAEPLAFTQGSDWYAVVTKEDLILIYNRSDGTLRQSIQISK